MPSDALYRSPEWRSLRARHLRRSPWCVVCLQVGFRTRANEVDHVRAVRLGGGALTPGNLQSLCGKHHRQKTTHSPEAGAGWRSPHPFTVTGPDGYPMPAGISPPTDDEPEEI